MHDRPKAKTDGVVSERIDNELVVYDGTSHTAHCLSSEAALVWEQCDGRASQGELAEQLALSAAAVERAVDALSECDLLDEGPAASSRWRAQLLAPRGGGKASEGRRRCVCRAADLFGGGGNGAGGVFRDADPGLRHHRRHVRLQRLRQYASGSQPPRTRAVARPASGACTGARRCSPGPPTLASTTRRAVTACAIAQRITHAVTRTSAQRSTNASRRRPVSGQH